MSNLSLRRKQKINIYHSAMLGSSKLGVWAWGCFWVENFVFLASDTHELLCLYRTSAGVYTAQCSYKKYFSSFPWDDNMLIMSVLRSQILLDFLHCLWAPAAGWNRPFLPLAFLTLYGEFMEHHFTYLFSYSVFTF